MSDDSQAALNPVVLKNPNLAAANESLAEQAYQILEHLIVTLELEPGALVNERLLIDMTGMGRTPLREAIQRLSWEGLMEVRPRSGIAVSMIDPNDFNKVLDAREGVERILARDASRFGSNKDFEKLEVAAEEMQLATHSNNVIQFLNADKAFDLVLGSAAGNAYAARLAAPLQTHSRRFWFRLQAAGSITTSAEVHTALIKAIVSRDPVKATNAAEQLIRHLRTLAP